VEELMVLIEVDEVALGLLRQHWGRLNTTTPEQLTLPDALFDSMTPAYQDTIW
jgi:hypothetical protein